MLEQYYFGQGRVYSRRWGVAGAPWRWWGDVSDLKFAASADTIKHQESYTGNKLAVRSIPIGKTMNISGTVQQIDTVTLTDLLGGTVTSVAAGAVTGEILGTIAAGDIIKLDYPGVSALVVTDSNASPATIDAANYDSSLLPWGTLEFLSLPDAPAPTPPLLAAYSYSGYDQVSFFTTQLPMLEFRYEGINLAEDNAPVICEFYKGSPDPLKELALISTGNSLAGTAFTLEALYDTTKPDDPVLGRFGRFMQVKAAA